MRKETIKAQYTAAEAQTKIGESLSGISEDMADVGMAMERAENKVQTMQARAGAIDELLESGALDDLTASGDAIDKRARPDRVAGRGRRRARRLKSELGAGSAPSGQIGSGGGS